MRGRAALPRPRMYRVSPRATNSLEISELNFWGSNPSLLATSTRKQIFLKQHRIFYTKWQLAFRSYKTSKFAHRNRIFLYHAPAGDLGPRPQESRF